MLHWFKKNPFCILIVTICDDFDDFDSFGEFDTALHFFGFLKLSICYNIFILIQEIDLELFILFCSTFFNPQPFNQCAKDCV